MMNAKSATIFWPSAIVLLIFFFLSLTAWSIHRATIGVSSVTNPRYYSHGLKYNQTLVEKEAATALGWNLETSLDGRTLLFHLSDSSGQAVSGAQGGITLFDAERQSNHALRETAPGIYVTEIPVDPGTHVSARIDLRRRGASLSRALLLNL